MHFSGKRVGVASLCFVVIAIENRGAIAETAKRVVTNSSQPTPICSVQREVYIAAPEPGAAAGADRVTYVGDGLRRREFITTGRRSDIVDTKVVRYSEDNGRTWSEPVDLPSDESRVQNGNHLVEHVNATIFDPVAKKTVEMVYQRVYLGEVELLMNRALQAKGRGFVDHGFYRFSDDDGRTWSERRLLTYEPGEPFDPHNWANPEYLKHNELWGTYEAYTLSDGRIAYPVVTRVAYEEDEEDRRICRGIPWYLSTKGYIHGVMCFFGKWNAAKGDYDWTHSDPIWVPRRVSTRGLEEPMLAELVDGTLLLDMRGSNKKLDPKTYPARRWISTSKDHGRTWSIVRDLRYDTGEPFYSPEAQSCLVRSGKTGILYWIGNISSTPVKAQSPRYPLFIAEIDEEKVALKKHTLTMVDDRGPTDTEQLQLSNFSVLDNRETGELEIYLTRYGESKEGGPLGGNSYKYTLTLNE